MKDIFLNLNMTEIERNKRLILLLQKLIHENEIQYIELIGDLVSKDTSEYSESMRKSYEIITGVDFKSRYE
jgi:hypothetical protein